MKKVLVLLFTVVSVFVICSCSQSVKIPSVITNINSDALVEYGGTEYECHITRLTDGVVSICLNSPENLSGLTFRLADGKYSVSYDELLCRTDSVFLPETAFPTMIINILSVANTQENLIYQSSENGLVTFTGTSNTGGFQLITDTDGNITEIFQETQGLKVSITNA